MTACVGTTEEVRRTASGARKVGNLNVRTTGETIEITTLKGVTVYAALLKSPGVWIVRYSPDHFTID